MRVAVVAVALFACKDVDSRRAPDVEDAPPMVDAANPGFIPPSDVLAAWTEPAPGTFEPAVLDLSCLGLPRTEVPTTMPVSLAITVRDFQSGNTVPGAMITAFAGSDTTAQLASGTTDPSAHVSLTFPANQTRVGFRITSSSTRPTYAFDHALASSNAVVLQSMSLATGATLPALIGDLALPDTAIVLGRMRDCQGHTVSNFVATVTNPYGIDVSTYYFSEDAGLPVRHAEAHQAARDGRFMIIDIPPLAPSYVQVWGFRDHAEMIAGTMTRIAELAVPFTADAAVIVAHEPWATN